MTMSASRRQIDRTATRGSVEVMSRAEVMGCARWASAFAGKHKDHRYYELVEETIQPDFVFRYFAIKDEDGSVRAVQPFFIIDQDLLLGTNTRLGGVIGFIRRLWPRFMKMRTLMVGCAAGEGHLDGTEQSHRASVEILAASITGLARKMNAPLIVLKEFSAQYRDALQCLVHHGFARVPSMPNTRLNIDYANFDDYMNKALGQEMRRNLRRKFRAAEKASVIEMTVVNDVTSIVKDIYPLYLKVYERSKLKFEKLTECYFCGLGRLMPDKARFFVWHQGKTIVAFMSCLIEGDELCAEYIGLEYPVALDLHLYFYSFRDVVSWAIANGKWYRSTSLNYDPKFHLKHSLDPVDLYVRHTSKFINPILRRLLPLLEPTRNDKTLPKFSNYADLWARRPPFPTP
jgi:Peptidogalycan biosysnthesis/recognition